MPYAENTTVPVERSRAELERILERYGADAFMYGWNGDGAAIQFRAHGRHVKFELPLPPKDDPQFTSLPSGETAGEWMRPQVEKAYASGAMPKRLQLALPAGKSD